MGTNFYWKAPKGHELEVYADLHVGKRSGGWAFSFKGYRADSAPAQSKAIEVGTGLYVHVNIPSVPAVAITSWSDWKALITLEGSELRNEYQELVEPADFIQQVENELHPEKGSWGPHRAPLMNHVPYCRQNYSTDSAFFDPLEHWQDAEGYSFSDSEFS